MPTEFKRAIFKSGDSYRITIPMPIVTSLGIKEKEVLTIWQDNSHIILSKDKQPAKTKKPERKIQLLKEKKE